MNTKNILITGGAGFIGSHLVNSLINESNVIVIDNLSNGTYELIEKHTCSENFFFYNKDIAKDFLDDIFEKHSINKIYHFAANSDIEKSHKNPDIDYLNTFLTTFNILKLMVKFNIKEIVFASTSAIYGDTLDLLHENYGPLLPISHYGANKLASESVISSFTANYNFKAIIVRFPNVIGPFLTHGVIYDFNAKLLKNKNELLVLGDGNQHKPYLYIEDLLNAIFLIEKNSTSSLNIFNIGNTSRSKVNFIADQIRQKINFNAKIIYTGGKTGWIGDVPEFKYDISKLFSLGWKPKFTSDEAIIETIKSL